MWGVTVHRSHPSAPAAVTSTVAVAAASLLGMSGEERATHTH